MLRKTTLELLTNAIVHFPHQTGFRFGCSFVLLVNCSRMFTTIKWIIIWCKCVKDRVWHGWCADESVHLQSEIAPCQRAFTNFFIRLPRLGFVCVCVFFSHFHIFPLAISYPSVPPHSRKFRLEKVDYPPHLSISASSLHIPPPSLRAFRDL